MIGDFSRRAYGLQMRMTADSPDHAIQITGGPCGCGHFTVSPGETGDCPGALYHRSLKTEDVTSSEITVTRYRGSHVKQNKPTGPQFYKKVSKV